MCPNLHKACVRIHTESKHDPVVPRYLACTVNLTAELLPEIFDVLADGAQEMNTRDDKSHLAEVQHDHLICTAIRAALDLVLQSGW